MSRSRSHSPRSVEPRPADRTTDVEHRPAIWTRRHEFDWGHRRIRQVETYFNVPVSRFEPVMVDNPSPSEAAAFHAFAWTTPERSRVETDIVAPRRLADLVDDLVEPGPPDRLIDAGVWPARDIWPSAGDPHIRRLWNDAGGSR